MRSGVSVIVASVVMLVIVAAAGAAIYSYAQGTFSNLSASFSEMLSSRAEELDEGGVVVDYFYVNASSTALSLAIYNYGRVDLEVVSAIINGTACSPNEEVYLAPGEWCWVNVTYPSHLSSGNVYYVKLVSKRGNTYAAYVVP